MNFISSECNDTRNENKMTILRVTDGLIYLAVSYCIENKYKHD